MRCVAVAAVLFAAAGVAAGEPAKATRVIEGARATFPDKSVPDGVKALTGVLESCHSMSDVRDGTARHTPDDLKKVRTGDPVRFVFPEPLRVEVLGRTLEVSEAVFGEGGFWLVRGNDVVRCTKYKSDKMDRFREWYRQTLPAD